MSASLDESARVAAAMIAAGRSPRTAEHFPEKHRKELASLVSADGAAVPGVRDKVISVLRAAGQELKATVDDTEVDE